MSHIASVKIQLNSPRLAFFVITDQGSDRIPSLMKSYGKDLDNHPNVEFHIIDSPSNIDLPQNCNVSLTQNAIDLMHENVLYADHDPVADQTISIAAKFYIACHYFIENTNASWLFRATDDTFVNVDLLDEVITKYEIEEGDPRTTVIIKGNCIYIRKNSYLQGGAGFLISRRAIELMLPELPDFVRKVQVPEDEYFNHLIDYVSYSLYKSTSEHFVGLGFYVTPQKIEEGADLPQPCITKSYNPKSQCRHFVAPLKQIVFFHDSSYQFNCSWEIALQCFKQSSDYYNYFIGEAYPWICDSRMDLPLNWTPPHSDRQLQYGNFNITF